MTAVAAPTRPPECDLSRAPGPGSPWARMAAFLRAHAWTEEDPAAEAKRRPWSPRSATTFVVVRDPARDVRVLFEVRARRTQSGELVNLNLRSRDPERRFARGWRSTVGVSVSFTRTGILSGDAYIGDVAASPKHGLARGNDALGVGVALCRYFGVERIKLHDASRLPCSRVSGDAEPAGVDSDDDDEPSMPLRAMRILTKGEGWYEAHGFRSIEQVLDPDAHRAHVSALRAVRTQELLAAVREIDAGLRAAILERAEVLGTSEDEDADGGGGLHPLKLAEVMRVVERWSDVLEAFEELRKRRLLKPTVGGTVSAALQGDCVLAARLVKGILPLGARRSRVAAERVGARALPARPAEASWRYVEALGNELTLELASEM